MKLFVAFFLALMVACGGGGGSSTPGPSFHINLSVAPPSTKSQDLKSSIRPMDTPSYLPLPDDVELDFGIALLNGGIVLFQNYLFARNFHRLSYWYDIYINRGMESYHINKSFHVDIYSWHTVIFRIYNNAQLSLYGSHIR